MERQRQEAIAKLERDQASDALKIEARRQEAEKTRREEERKFRQHREEVRDKLSGFSNYKEGNDLHSKKWGA